MRINAARWKSLGALPTQLLRQSFCTGYKNHLIGQHVTHYLISCELSNRVERKVTFDSKLTRNCCRTQVCNCNTVCVGWTIPRGWVGRGLYPNSCLAYPNEILPHVHHSCCPTQNLLGPLTGLPLWKFLEPPLTMSYSYVVISLLKHGISIRIVTIYGLVEQEGEH